jgi:hypothetical protein
LRQNRTFLKGNFRPALPRALRIAEASFDLGRQRKSSMIRKFLAAVAAHWNFQIPMPSKEALSVVAHSSINLQHRLW